MMTVEQQVAYLASWRHKDLCGVPHIMKPKGPPDHSWLDCPKMARFHWAASTTPSDQGAADG